MASAQTVSEPKVFILSTRLDVESQRTDMLSI